MGPGPEAACMHVHAPTQPGRLPAALTHLQWAQGESGHSGAEGVRFSQPSHSPTPIWLENLDTIPPKDGRGFAEATVTIWCRKWAGAHSGRAASLSTLRTHSPSPHQRQGAPVLTIGLEPIPRTPRIGLAPTRGVWAGSPTSWSPNLNWMTIRFPKVGGPSDLFIFKTHHA